MVGISGEEFVAHDWWDRLAYLSLVLLFPTTYPLLLTCLGPVYL